MHRLSDGPELRALTYATLFELLPHDKATHKVALMVGLPVEVMANHQLALATRRQLRAWLRATHTFSVADVPMTVEVAQVQIMAQPAGAFFAWGFDNAGHWQQDQAAAEATIGICDIGFNTLDSLQHSGRSSPGTLHGRG